MPLTSDYVRKHFDAAAAGDYDTFFSKVDPNVDWTVMGHHALSKQYKTLQEFKMGTFARLSPRMQGGKLALTLTNCIVEGQQALVELSADATQLSGRPFANRYAWVVMYSDGGIINQVRAYLDGELVNECINENDGP